MDLKLYVATGTGMACQTMARFFSSRFAQLGAIYAHLMVPGLNSGRLAVYSCDHVKQYMGTFRFEVPIYLAV